MAETHGRRDANGTNGRFVSTHGKSWSREHTAWMNAKHRCAVGPGRKDHAWYAGRGITMCARWGESFEAFLSDMGPCPPGMSIDRKDNDGDYEPGNCRWATAMEQARNRRTSRIVTIDGESKTLVEWAAMFRINRGTVQARIDKYGWEPLRAITTPARSIRRASRVRNA